MQNKILLMLTAPSMIGKSYAAEKVCAEHPSISIIKNDDLLHELFSLVRLPDFSIEDVDIWRDQVNLKADCNALIRLLHRDRLVCSSKHSIFLAEGHTYMFRWYREQVRIGLAMLGFNIDRYLLKYEPSISDQVQRQTERFTELSWHETDEEHQRQLRVKWNKFEEPKDENLFFETINDISLPRVIERINGIYQ